MEIQSNPILLGRVHKILLDRADERFYERLGREESIGTIFFTFLNEDVAITEDFSMCRIAKPLYYNFLQYPIAKELVHVMQAPHSTYNEEGIETWYYMNPIAIHNSPQGNPLPSQLDWNSEYIQGRYFKIREDVRPLRPYEGDVILEGRFGNSIRFGSTIDNSNEGTYHPNKWSNEGNIGDPITIIRNGQKGHKQGESYEHILENINADDSSIYLCTNQQISNFIPASINGDSYQSTTSVFNRKQRSEPSVPDTNLEEDTVEDLEMNPPDTIPPIELQQNNYLQNLEDSETPFYDIAPTEQQVIPLNSGISSLPDNYIIPAGVTHSYLAEGIGTNNTRFTRYENIYSETANANNINNFPGIDKDNDPLLTEGFIWHNLEQLHTYVIGPIINAFGDIAIKSSYRTKALNAILDGVENSQHTRGYAVDIISFSRPTSVIFNWCINNLPHFNQIIWEYPERGSFSGNNIDCSWIHISYNEYNNPKTMSLSSEKESIHNFYSGENTSRVGNFTHHFTNHALETVLNL